MKKADLAEVVSMTILTVLAIACFPVNPLALTGVVDTGYNLPLFVLGWIAWAFGMVLVMSPIVMFPRRGGVPRGQSFVHTTRLVDTGIYSVVRHPQYLGGALAIFVATPLLYYHWLFAALGIPALVILYFSTAGEEKRLVEQFGDDYRDYMKRVPRMNIVLGVIRQVGRRKEVKIQ
jgi:protein-S-isoprenylcysteine O-methyltransferase Ste14